MKHNKIKLLAATTLTAMFVLGCAATDYSSPSDVTKTGTDTTSGIYFDSSKLTQTSFSTPTTFGGCTTAADYNTKILVSTAQVLSINIQSITAAASPGSSGVQCGEAQAIAYLPNAGDNVWKSVLTGTITIGASNIVNQSVIFQRAFSADLDKDGTTDVVSYNVSLGGAATNNITASRTVRLSSAGSCQTSRTVPCASATVSSANAQITNAALQTAGDHTFSITWQTQTGTSNAGGAVTIVIDGVTVSNGTSAGIENPGANLAAGAADPAPSGILVSGTTAAAWAVLNASAVPVNAMNIIMKGGTGAPGAQTAASNPTLKNLKWSKS